METHNYWTAMAFEVSQTRSCEIEEHEDSEDYEDEHSKHKYGLCDECGQGLDDKSEFVTHRMKEGYMAMICLGCFIEDVLG